MAAEATRTHQEIEGGMSNPTAMGGAGSDPEESLGRHQFNRVKGQGFGRAGLLAWFDGQRRQHPPIAGSTSKFDEMHAGLSIAFQLQSNAPFAIEPFIAQTLPVNPCHCRATLAGRMQSQLRGLLGTPTSTAALLGSTGS